MPKNPPPTDPEPVPELLEALEEPFLPRGEPEILFCKRVQAAGEPPDDYNWTPPAPTGPELTPGPVPEPPRARDVVPGPFEPGTVDPELAPDALPQPLQPLKGERLTAEQREFVARNLVLGVSPTTIARALQRAPDYIKRLDKYDEDMQARKAKWHHVAIRSMGEIQLGLRDLVPRSVEKIEADLREDGKSAIETAKFVINTVLRLDQNQRAREEPATVQHKVVLDGEVAHAFTQIGKLAEAIGSGPSPTFNRSVFQGTSSLIAPGEIERVEAPDKEPSDS